MRQALHASPSPFADQTRVSFDLAAPAHVRLTVHDVRGRKVATLQDGVRNVGPQTYVWTARDARDEALSSGIYFLRLEAETKVATRKLVLRR